MKHHTVPLDFLLPLVVLLMFCCHAIDGQTQAIIGQFAANSTINNALLLKRNDSDEEFLFVASVNQLCRAPLVNLTDRECVRTNVTSSDRSKFSRRRRELERDTRDNWNKLLVNFTRRSDGREWLIACGHENNGECELLDPWNLTHRVTNDDESVITNGVASTSADPNIRTLGGVLDAQIGPDAQQQALFVAATYAPGRGRSPHSVLSARALDVHVNGTATNALFTPFYKRAFQQEQNPQFGKSFELLTQLTLRGPVPHYVWFGSDDRFVYWIANQASRQSNSYESTMIRFCLKAERSRRYFQSMLEINVECTPTINEVGGNRLPLRNVIAAHLLDQILDDRLALQLNVSSTESALVLLMDDAMPNPPAAPTRYALCALPISAISTGFRNAVRRCSGSEGPPNNIPFTRKYLSVNLLKVCNDVNTTVPEDVRTKFTFL